MRRFWIDRRGNVAVLFALAVIPVVGAMGAGLDYSMANSYRAAMQKAADATALALSKVMPMDEAKLNDVARQYFLANFGQYGTAVPEIVVTPGQGSVKLHATLDYSPFMARVFGANDFEIGVAAEARWGIGKVEVALVLDNSGSMNDHGRMGHLKKAALELLEVLRSSAREPDDAKIAIVPFDQRVNVGPAHVNASWLNWTDWDQQNGRREAVTTCSGGNGKGKGKGGNCTTTYEWVPADRSTWQGCVLDRDRNNDIEDTAPSGNSTRYPASQCEHNLPYPGRVVQMQRLTNNWDALRTTVNSMQPAGYTNITIGLAWGWHLLSPNEVATEGAPYGTEDLTKFVILMTDGDNTRNRWGSTGFSNNMDDRTKRICENIKKTDIQIYTIRLVSGNASLLRDCATNPSMYYDVQDASQLAGVFKNIASQIASLHLSR